MFRPRIIPVLLLRKGGLVKSIKFKNYRYVGDPINSVRIFNDLRADELVFLDIEASKEGRHISFDLVKKIGDEANMPFAVGGGITSINQIISILKAGAEKVIINTAAVKNPDFIKKAVNLFGSSTIVISIDYKKDLFGMRYVYTNNGRKKTHERPFDFAKRMEDVGVGEIILNSIRHDGLMQGYDLKTINEISKHISIPLVASCGAGTIRHLKEAYDSGASALAAGSMFVFHGDRKAVLINYPDVSNLMTIFNGEKKEL